MSKSRAIRFSDSEEKQIEEFLRRNPIFDFSKLARMAILDFVENPKVNVHPVRSEKESSSRRRTNGQPN